MATKAAKSITINATKYQLANTLAVANGKIQLKADDVVLSEIDIPTPTLPPSAIKLMTVGLNDGHGGNYGKTEVLDYSDVFTGTGAGVEINEAKIAAGIIPRPKGRPRKDGQSPHQREKTELERLRMENKLLRDFLQLTGRK